MRPESPHEAVTVSHLEPHIQMEFGSRFEPRGFRNIGPRKWVRSSKDGIRQIFLLGAFKGGQYSPVWGFSSGLVPSFKGRSFHRQSTDKNAIMDLVIDPIDMTGSVPAESFSFIAGVDKEIPIEKIRACAEHFVPTALTDFDRVTSIPDFCQFFLERSRLQYQRFAFNMFVQHQLVYGFVLVLTGRREEGLQRIEEFCRSNDLDSQDRILTDCLRKAEAFSGRFN